MTPLAATSATAPARRWRNVTVTRERDGYRTRWMWGLLLGVLAAAAPLAIYLVQQMEHVQVRYRTETLRAERDRLVETERRLRATAAMLEAPERVERQAVRGLGLAHPASSRRVVVGKTGPGRGSLAPRAPDRESGAR